MIKVVEDSDSINTAKQELLELIEEFPVTCTTMPVPYFVALVCGSDAAIDIATDIAIERSYEEPVQTLTLLEPMPAECGALSQWKREIRAGKRKPTDSDALRAAAILEATARDELSQGLRNAARESRLKAAAIIVEAAGLRDRAA